MLEKNISVYLSPKIKDQVAFLEASLKKMTTPDLVLWNKISKIINEWQEEYWNLIAALPTSKNTIWFKSMFEGKEVPVGADGKMRRIKKENILKGGHRTGFLREKLTGYEENPYTLPPFIELPDGIAYQYGIDAGAFYNEYPMYLSDWLYEKFGSEKGIMNLIGVDDAKSAFLLEFIFDEIWNRLEVELLSHGWSRSE